MASSEFTRGYYQLTSNHCWGKWYSSLPQRLAQDGIYGDVHWHLDANGAMIIPTDNVGSLHCDSDPFYWGLTQMNYFKSPETVAVTEFARRQCFHLRGITKWDEENNYFFDKETGLLLGYQWQEKQPNGERSAASVVLSDYKDFGGRKFPTRSTYRGNRSFDIHR